MKMHHLGLISPEFLPLCTLFVQDNSFSAYLKQEAGSLTKVTASYWPMGTAEGHSELFYCRVSLAE